MKEQARVVIIGGSEYLTVYGGEAVHHNGRVLVRLHSAGYGYTFQRNAGYAYLPLELAQSGTGLQMDVFGEMIPAEVAADVPYDPRGERLRA